MTLNENLNKVLPVKGQSQSIKNVNLTMEKVGNHMSDVFNVLNNVLYKVLNNALYKHFYNSTTEKHTN